MLVYPCLYLKLNTFPVLVGVVVAIFEDLAEALYLGGGFEGRFAFAFFALRFFFWGEKREEAGDGEGFYFERFSLIGEGFVGGDEYGGAARQWEREKLYDVVIGSGIFGGEDNF